MTKLNFSYNTFGAGAPAVVESLAEADESLAEAEEDDE